MAEHDPGPIDAPACAVPQALREAAFSAVSTAFGSLGRVCMGLDADFAIRHVSGALDGLLGPGAAAAWKGRPVSDLLGAELLGPGGALRQALLAGERREGWRAWLRVEPDGTRLCSVSVAPLQHDPGGVCDGEATYILVLRPAEHDEATRGMAPTSFGGIIASSRAMTRVLRLMQDLQHSEATVLITGESGTGKGLLARAIHDHSTRRAGPFVAVNCAALPETLLEPELFGHVRGAFTGAVRDRVGRIELAAGGTLFLDEVGDLPSHLQVKLLRALQERTFERVGESKPLPVEARVIAATHQDLKKGVEQRRFREDLYYRLRVFPVEIPPLRERREDVEPLARSLLRRVGDRHGRELRFSPDALRALLDYPWPGNVRELENALEYASTVARGQTIQPEDLPLEVTGRATATPARAGDGVGGRDAERVAERTGWTRARRPPPPRDEVMAALESHRWRVAETSSALQVSRTTLWRWMRELGLER